MPVQANTSRRLLVGLTVGAVLAVTGCGSAGTSNSLPFLSRNDPPPAWASDCGKNSQDREFELDPSQGLIDSKQFGSKGLVNSAIGSCTTSSDRGYGYAIAEFKTSDQASAVIPWHTRSFEAQATSAPTVRRSPAGLPKDAECDGSKGTYGPTTSCVMTVGRFAIVARFDGAYSTTDVDSISAAIVKYVS